MNTGFKLALLCEKFKSLSSLNEKLKSLSSLREKYQSLKDAKQIQGLKLKNSGSPFVDGDDRKRDVIPAKTGIQSPLPREAASREV